MWSSIRDRQRGRRRTRRRRAEAGRGAGRFPRFRREALRGSRAASRRNDVCRFALRQGEHVMTSDLGEAALEYHRLPTPGKISVTPTKSMVTQRDLAFAYSPGVAEASHGDRRESRPKPHHVPRQSGSGRHQRHRRARPRQIGPFAGKPVMEGKGVLFKKFAGIDVFDIEIEENDPDKLVDTIAASSRPSAASTSRTSRRRSASTSRSELRER